MVNPGHKHQLVIIGGSYPGALSAWFKSLYPDHAVASWSSSGVINAIEDFKGFDQVLFLSTLNGGYECPHKIYNLTVQIENIVKGDNETEKQSLFTTFNNNNKDIVIGDFMFFVADIFTMGVQYGHRIEMCELLESDDFNQDPLAGLAKYAEESGVRVSDYDAESLKNTTFDINKNIRQWTYQYCTEFGWF